MKQAVIDLFSSKKFIATLVTAAVAIGAKVGFDLDAEMVALIVGLGATYITSQGIADHGKEAAKIQANVVDTPSGWTPIPPGGVFRMASSGTADPGTTTGDGGGTYKAG